MAFNVLVKGDWKVEFFAFNNGLFVCNRRPCVRYAFNLPISGFQIHRIEASATVDSSFYRSLIGTNKVLPFRGESTKVMSQ